MCIRDSCGTCRFYRPHWKDQFCVYEECPYQPGKLTALDLSLIPICFSQDEDHHLALVKGAGYLELHKSIVKPETRINSDYLVGHTQMLKISGNKILTLDATATLWYVMYHAYSHMETAGQGMTRKYLLEHKYIYFYPYSICLLYTSRCV